MNQRLVSMGVTMSWIGCLQTHTKPIQYIRKTCNNSKTNSSMRSSLRITTRLIVRMRRRSLPTLGKMTSMLPCPTTVCVLPPQMLTTTLSFMRAKQTWRSTMTS
uniref:Uncharacterized protein n=1 Tax=Cacopsylla melanoneura TaxID=428564 RepID=A0A8D8W8M0_9HEMI